MSNLDAKSGVFDGSFESVGRQGNVKPHCSKRWQKRAINQWCGRGIGIYDEFGTSPTPGKGGIRAQFPKILTTPENRKGLRYMAKLAPTDKTKKPYVQTDIELAGDVRQIQVQLRYNLVVEGTGEGETVPGFLAMEVCNRQGCRDTSNRYRKDVETRPQQLLDETIVFSGSDIRNARKTDWKKFKQARRVTLGQDKRIVLKITFNSTKYGDNSALLIDDVIVDTF